MDKKYYLGLDLGISSVGWAVMCEEGDEYYIDDFGVRLFEVAEDHKKGTTHAEERRTFRGARRLNRRRKQRIKEIKDFLRENNIVTDEQLANFYREKKTTNLIKYNEDQYFNFNPYGLRVKGLTEKLTGEELGVILIHIANSRGYNDKFSFNKEDKKQATKLDSALNKANLLIQSHKTIASAIVNEQEFKSKENANLIVVRNRLSASVKKKSTKNNENQEKDNTNNKDAVGYKFLFAREDYRKELNLILEKQTEFYPQLKDKVYKLVEEIILRQRDFESGPGPKSEIQYEKWKNYMKTQPRMKQRFYPNFLSLKAKCNFFKNEERGFMSSLIFDIYHLVVELSKYTVRFSEEENKKVAQAVFNFVINSKEKIDKTEIKKKIEASLDNKHKISTSDSAWKNIKLFLEYTKLLKTVFSLNLFEHINFHDLKDNFFHQLGEQLHKNITPKRREECINKLLKENNLDISKENMNNFLGYKKVSTGNVSFSYMQEAINAFLDGIPYGKFQDAFIKKQELNEKDIQEDIKNNPKQLKALFSPIIEEDLWKSSTVFRAVNQTRKVLKALHQKYEQFAVINVEVANELAKSFKDRKKIEKQNDISFAENKKFENELEAKGINVNPTNVLKYRLWKQQLGMCFYSEEKIDLNMLTNTSLLQIDHIIPQSKIADDSMQNKVLVFAKENQQKGKQVPLQWLKDQPEKLKRFQQFCNFLLSNRKISKNKYNYLMTETLDDETLNDFASRNLNDTRHITKYIVNWLKKEFKRWDIETKQSFNTKIQSINGKVTSRFRRIWLKESPWGLDTKVRDITPFHHAIDAIILTQFINFSYVTFASDIANISSLKQSLNHNRISQQDYEQSCSEILMKWKVAKDKSVAYKDKANWTTKVNLFVPNAVSRLQDIIMTKYSSNVAFSPLVQNLKDIVDARMPVLLKTEKVNVDVKINATETKTYSQRVPKYVNVLSKEEYLEKVRHMQGDIHYPFISYKVDRRLGGNYFSSENLVKKTKAIKNNELQESYFQDSKGAIWEVNKYYGVVMNYENDKLKPIWIRRIETKDNLKQFANSKIIRHNDVIEYFDKKENKKKIKIFKGKMGASVYAHTMGTVNIQDLKRSTDIFEKPNYYDGLGNWVDNKILNINILGKEI